MPEDADVAIEQALSSCRAGRGRTVLLTGPPGRGISRRLSRAADLARDRGMHVAVAAGRPAERSLAFSVAVDLFEPLWRAALPPAFKTDVAAGAARAAVRLLDLSDPSSPLGDGGYAVTRGMWVLARRLAEQRAPAAGDSPPRRTPRPRGLAVIVDDLHDVDGPTLGLLAYLTDRLGSSPVTVLAGRRVDVEPCAPAAVAAIARAAEVVAAKPLDARAGAALVGSLLPGASTQFAGACVKACAGNAALLHELVLGLAEHGLSGSDGETERIGTAVPDGIARLVAERFSRLQAPAHALVRAVAASDRPVTLEQAAASAGLSVDAALDAFDALVDADLLGATPPPAFVHPIVRAAVRASLTPGQRARLAPHEDGLAREGRERFDALTPSEARVARLAARGMTTRQIAETLFVTPKTVEFHLRNVYAKLEIPSTRAALARALDASDPVPSAG